MLFILGFAFMMIPGAILADRYSSRTVIFCAMLLAMGFFYLLLFIPLLSNAALLSLLFCLGAAVGVAQPVALALGTDLPQSKGHGQRLFNGSGLVHLREHRTNRRRLFSHLFHRRSEPAKSLAILGGLFYSAAPLPISCRRINKCRCLQKSKSTNYAKKN